MMTNRFAKACFLVFGAVALGACGAPSTDADELGTSEGAIGSGSPALRRDFAKIAYDEAGLEFVMIQRTEHESTAGRGNYVRYDVSAHGAIVDSATCVTTQIAGGDVEASATNVLTGAPDDHGTLTLASRSGPTHAAYTIDEIRRVDVECFVEDAPYFHVSCSESESTFECTRQE